MPSDPAQLVLLALVRRRGSLAGAASDLRVTPAAVTAQLRRAERDWGAHLVVRGPRGAQLTDLGGVLAAAGDAILAVVDGAGLDFKECRESGRRRLRIGTFQTVAEHLLPPVVMALRHRRPDIDLSIRESTSPEALDQLRKGTIDVAVVARHLDAHEHAPGADSGDLHWQSMLTDPIVLCLPDGHHLLEQASPRGQIRLSELAAEPWIVVSQGIPARDQFDRAAAEAGFVPRIQAETDSYAAAQALVGAGLGIAAISRLAARATSGVVHVALGQPRLSRRIFAVTRLRDAGLNAASHEFIDLLRKAADELEWPGQASADRELPARGRH